MNRHKLNLVYTALDDYPVIAEVVLLFLIIALAFRIRYFWKSKPNGFTLFENLYSDETVPLILLFLGATTLMFALQMGEYLDIRAAYNSGEMKFIEGRVLNLSSTTEGKRLYDDFEVNGVTFEVSTYQIRIKGYDKTVSDGGMIREQELVKIGYFNDEGRNIILKLETEANTRY